MIGDLPTDINSGNILEVTKRIIEVLNALKPKLDNMHLLLQSQRPVYTPTNVTIDRTYDADATSTAELADILGTLIADLQSKKVIG